MLYTNVDVNPELADISGPFGVNILQGEIETGFRIERDNTYLNPHCRSATLIDRDKQIDNRLIENIDPPDTTIRAINIGIHRARCVTNKIHRQNRASINQFGHYNETSALAFH